LKTSPAPEIQF